MPIPKPSETKQPILNYLTKAGRPVKVSAITEFVGQHFNLSKKEMEDRSPNGTKRLVISVNASTKEMKAKGLAKSPRRGFLEITPKGRGGLTGLTTQAVIATNGRRKPGRPPKVQVAAPTNGRRKPGRPPMTQAKAPTNGRRKPGRPKTQPATQFSAPRSPSPSVTSMKRDDKIVQKTADIVVAYVGKNTVPANQIPSIIHSTYEALAGLGN